MVVLYRSYGVVMICYHGRSGSLKDHDGVPFLEVRLLYTLVACVAGDCMFVCWLCTLVVCVA